MKCILILCLFLAISSNASKAQIIFTSDELIAYFNQQTNQTNYHPASLDGFQQLIDKSGPSQTWDFSSITWIKDTTTGSTSTFLPYPSGAALADDSDFSGSTHVMKSVFSFPPFPIQIDYEFYKIDQTGFWILGVSEDNLGTKSKIFSYSPAIQYLQFPLSYQTSWSQTSNVKDGQLPSGLTSTGKIDAIVDGYGTLILPNSSSDCLRLKYKINDITNDSGINLYSSYEFLWITNNGVSAWIDADSNQKATTTTSPNNHSSQPTRYSSQSTSSVGNNSLASNGLSDLHLSQNPTSSETKLFFNLRASGNVKVSLMDALGREVHILQNGYAEAGQNAITIDPSKLATGSYFIRVNTYGMTAMRKLIITK